MGSLNHALRCLFERALEGTPPEYENEEGWREACQKAFDAVAKASKYSVHAGMTWNDLYTYFSKEVEGNLDVKSVDALFRYLDRGKRKIVNLQEFTDVVLQRLSSLREERELEARLATRVPRMYVVPGSNRLNTIARTDAFKVQVVTRAAVREVGQVWMEMDADKDGRVSLGDLRRYFSRTQPSMLPFLTSMFRAMEGRGRSGVITFQHLLKALYPEATPSDVRVLEAMATSSKSRAAAAAEAAANDKLLQDLQGVFMVFDDEQQGELDEEEFVSAMELTGHTVEIATSMFKLLNTDGSGVVRWRDFRRWYVVNYRKFIDEAQRKGFEDGAEDGEE